MAQGPERFLWKGKCLKSISSTADKGRVQGPTPTPGKATGGIQEGTGTGEMWPLVSHALSSVGKGWTPTL